MDFDPSVCEPMSFFRRPEWRWLRAEHRHASRIRRHPRTDDAWVDEVCHFLGGTGKPRASSAAIRAAHSLWTGDPVTRGEMEARLLTETPLDEIAAKSGVSPATVEAYEALFYAVRAYMRASDWILSRVIEYAPWTGFRGPMPYSAWKLAAYAGGPILLELVMAATTGRALTSRLRMADPDGGVIRARIWVDLMAAVTVEQLADVILDRRRLLGDAAPLPGDVVEREEFLLDLAERRRGPKPERRTGTTAAAPSATRSRVPSPGGKKPRARRKPTEFK